MYIEGSTAQRGQRRSPDEAKRNPGEMFVIANTTRISFHYIQATSSSEDYAETCSVRTLRL